MAMKFLSFFKISKLFYYFCKFKFYNYDIYTNEISGKMCC